MQLLEILYVGGRTFSAVYNYSVEANESICKYSKTCVKQLLKIDKSNVLMTNGGLMKVKSIAECSPALSDNWS